MFIINLEVEQLAFMRFSCCCLCLAIIIGNRQQPKAAVLIQYVAPVVLARFDWI